PARTCASPPPPPPPTRGTDMPRPEPRTVAGLTAAVLAGAHGPDPRTLHVTSAFRLYHTTRLAGSDVTYHNHYLVLRTGPVFGACACEAGEVAPEDRKSVVEGTR